MFPLIAVVLPDFSRGESTSRVARVYAATRMNLEATPVNASEASFALGRRKPGNRRNQRPLSQDPHTGNNLDIFI